MTMDINHVPEGTVIHISPKGGDYVIVTEGQKHYIRLYRWRSSTTFKAKRRAYLRFIENQAINA